MKMPNPWPPHQMESSTMIVWALSDLHMEFTQYLPAYLEPSERIWWCLPATSARVPPGSNRRSLPSPAGA